jgi:hypothetical protein
MHARGNANAGSLASQDNNNEKYGEDEKQRSSFLQPWQ